MKFFHSLVSLTLVILLIQTPAGVAQDASPEVSVAEMSAQLQQDMQDLERLGRHIDSASERDRAALVFRRDERSFELLLDLDRLVRATAALPQTDPLKAQVTAQLQDYLQEAGKSVLLRLAEVEERVTRLQTEAASLGGAQLVATEAYIQSLENLRFRYYEALVKVIEGRKSLALAEGPLASSLLPMLYLQGEAMLGRIVYTGEALDELRMRQGNEPDNADLGLAATDMARRQAQDLAHLKTLIGLLERLGEDPVDYQAILLHQGQGLSITALEGSAIVSLLEDSWEGLRSSLAEQAPDLVFNLVIFVIIILVFRSLSKMARRAVKAACERPGVDMSTLLKDVLISVCGGTVTVVGVLIALSQVGISLGPMLAGLGVAGFVVGFALQDTLGNFAAGGMILIYRPYDVDDYIEVAGASGLVKKMSLVSTTITTFDNQTLVIPNSKIWGDVIKNVTAQKLRRVDLVFGIGYGDDIEHAERVLRDVLDDHEAVLSKPEPLIKLHELADSSVNFAVRPWVKTEDYWNVYWDITREVKMRFDREGISIPFPQRDVHLYPEAAS
jgi:small conductance mechanosensitive channel